MTQRVYWLVQDCGPAVTQWSDGANLDFLAPVEQERMAGLRFPRRRYEWLAGRWAAKQLLRRCEPRFADVAESAIAILNRDSGAPYVVVNGRDETPGCLSISHRNQVAACAWLGDGGAVGIDLEWIEPRDPSFLSDYFTPHEQAAASALPPDARDVWVTLAWSVKESALKVLGVGLRIDTRRIEVRMADSLDAPGAAQAGWQAAEVTYLDQPGSRIQAWQRRWGAYALTLAVSSPHERVELVEAGARKTAVA